MRTIYAFRLIVAIAAVVGFSLPTTALAQSIVVEGLQALWEDANNDFEREEVERLGRTIHTELTAEVNELQAVQQAAEGPVFLVYDSSGQAQTVSEQSVRDRAESMALEFVTAQNSYDYFMGTLSRGRSNGGVDNIVANSFLLAFDQAFEGGGITSTIGPGELGLVLEEIMLNEFAAVDAHGRARLANEIAALHEQRDAVWAIVDAAAEFDFYDSIKAPPQPEGFMNEPGYWIVQISGSGWHKGGANYATRIVGYENVIIQITDEVSEPTQTRWYWQLPPGYDIAVHERERQEAVEESSRDYCAGPPALGPRSPLPYIWDDGPHYEIVEGPITDWAEAREARGNSRLSNNDPEGTKFWNHQSGFTHEDLAPVCRRYGVDLGG